MPNFLQIATPLVERGFSVIPLESGGKRPTPPWGVMSRTRDLEMLANWDGDRNVGICADVSTVILETDDYDRLSQTVKLGTQETFPLTLTACGSSENRPHLFFRRTEKATNVGNLVVPGLFEARFNNQYVVGPGSIHPSGATYRFLNDAPMVDIPDWLVSELARLAQTQKTRQPATFSVGPGGKIPEGEGRHYAIRDFCSKNCTPGKSLEQQFEEAMAFNEANCEPPHTAAHVASIVNWYEDKEPYDPGPKVVLGLSSGKEETEKKTSVEKWVAVTARELKAMDIPPRQAVLTETETESILFYESSINQILAWRGVGKTNFGLALAGAMATGGSLLGFKTDRPRKVLYIDGELPKAQLQERIRAFVPVEHDDNIFLFSPELIEPPRGLDFIQPTDAEALKQLAAAVGAEVLFIDSQSTTMMGDSLTTEYQEARLKFLRALRWSKLCVIEMHHVGKSQMQRGLSRNDDILDVQMHLKKMADWEPEDGVMFEMAYEKVRHASRLETGYVVALENGVWTKRVADKVAAAAELYNEGKTDRDVAKKLKVSHGTANNLRKKAFKAGLIHSSIKTDIGGVKSQPKGVTA